MEKYLANLIAHNSRLIIPEFGALIARNDPERSIYFNEFFKFNDGLLINHIVEKEKISLPQAAQKVKDFIEDVKQKLHSGKNFNIGDMGYLYLDESSKVQFKYSKSSQNTMVEEVVPEKKIEKQDEVVSKSVQSDLKSAIAEDETSKKEEPIPVIQEKMATPSIEEAKVVEEKIIVPPPQYVSPPLPPRTNVPPPVSTSSTYERKSPPSNTSTPISKQEVVHVEKTKRHVGLWVTFILLILLAGGTAVWIIKFDGKTQLLDWKKQAIAYYQKITKKTPAPEVISPDSIVAKPIVKDEPKLEKEPVIYPSPGTTGKKYYIVGGSFVIEKNADNYVYTLKDKGYSSEKFGTFGRFHVVSYKVFDTKKEALQELARIRKEVEPTAWVLGY